jgi:hypothetical protein
MFSLLHEFGKMTAIENEGGIIVLEMMPHEYSLHDIAKIVESNDAKILSSYIKSDPNKSSMEVTLKLNKIDLSSVLRTFDRYSYNIKASYGDDSKLETLYYDRYEMFMNYINV